MQPAPDRPPSTSPSTPSPGRRALSRFTSILPSKPRSVADFYIALDEPHRQYSSGDTVRGSVRLRVLRHVRITHLVVCLHGFVQVYKHPGGPGEGIRTNAAHTAAGRGKSSGRYHGNGFATLFDDEVILCGDGRLAERSYQFNFELEFPESGLPSSIDFERGTISYTITATMTRPTTIAPTLTCDRKVFFVEPIDVSRLCPPKPRTIILDPIVKKNKSKSPAHKLAEATDRKSSANAESTATTEKQQDAPSKRSPRVSREGERPLSPASSEVSSESRMSTGCGPSFTDSRSTTPKSHSTVRDTRVHGKSHRSTKPIGVTIESGAGGCLRGDHVPIKISVSHAKHIRSMHGVIATLYRQAHVDLQPIIPIGPIGKGKKDGAEDYYPRSLTGLGGLSLSGAGSHHTFRKDMAQVVLPLVVDPITLSAEVIARPRVPDDAFPTISSVPGSMISFRYFIEVIVDIQGKLSGQERAMGSLGGLANAPVTASDLYEPEWTSPRSQGPAIIDTANVRRDKGVVSCSFEVVVGTIDSERRKGKRRLASVPVVPPQPHDADRDRPAGPPDFESAWRTSPFNPHWSQEYPRTDHPDMTDEEYEAWYGAPSPWIPAPRVAPESELSEKDRIRLAEARLLPGGPPDAEGEAGGGLSEATAPELGPGDFEMHASDHAAPPAENAGTAPSTPAYSEMRSSSPYGYGAAGRGPPPASPTPPSISSRARGDDKQELERARLEAQASAPPDEEGDRCSAATAGPSAPGLVAANEGSAHDSHADASAASDLPRYER